jgi:hypothetical protein
MAIIEPRYNAKAKAVIRLLLFIEILPTEDVVSDYLLQMGLARELIKLMQH